LMISINDCQVKTKMEQKGRAKKNLLVYLSKSGGRRGIRTPGAVSGSAVFKTAAFDHSAILPGQESKTIQTFKKLQETK
jgi:hypothetical protein